MSKNKLVVLTLVAFVLTACAPSEKTIQKAISQTLTSKPTIVVGAFRPGIESALFQQGDLPKNWTSGPITASLPSENSFGVIPSADLIVDQPIINIAYDQAGFILILYYRNSDDLNKAYEILFDGKPIEGFAEQAKSTTIGKIGDWHDVAFIRCSAIAFIRIYGLFESDVVDYSRRLDGRLINVLCK